MIWHRRNIARLLAAVAAALLGGFVLFATLVFSFDPSAPADGDAIVVLTGGEQRIHEAMRLFATGAARRILISGVNHATSRADLLRGSGLAPILFKCCVDIDQRAQDTLGNASETRAWVEPWGFRRLVVVTSNYHMPRTLLTLARMLPGVDLVPHAVVSPNYRIQQWWYHPSAVKLVAVEYLKSLPAALLFAVSRVPGVAGPGLSQQPWHEVSSRSDGHGL